MFSMPVLYSFSHPHYKSAPKFALGGAVIGLLSTFIAASAGAESGLCQVVAPRAETASSIGALQQVFARREDCLPDKAASLGLNLIQRDYQGRERILEMVFLPSVPLHSHQNCDLAQVPVMLDGQPTQFDFSLGTENNKNDMTLSGLNPRALYEVPESQRSAQTLMLRDTGLADHQALAIKGYMGGGYSKLNSALRSGTTDDMETAARIRLMVTGLNKMSRHPEYRAKGLVKRAVNMSVIDLEKLYPEGTCVLEKAFTSAAEGASGDGATRFGKDTLFILSKSGVRVSSLAGGRFEEEREVIFRPGTVFRVRNFISDGTLFGKTKIVLEECPCQE